MTEADPIRVYARNGKWLIDYGSYAQAWYRTRSEAIKVATNAAQHEHRELTIDPEPTAELLFLRPARKLATGFTGTHDTRSPATAASPSPTV